MGKLLDVARRISDAGIDIAVTADAAQFRRAGRLHPGTGTIAMRRQSAGRSDHGQQVGLGRHAPGRRGADEIRCGARVPRAFGAPHAARDGGVCQRRPKRRGIEVIIAAAGGAAHLAGVCAAHTLLPVLGVPMESAALKGMDSLLSTVQMPAGIPVGTLAIGPAGRAQCGAAGDCHPGQQPPGTARNAAPVPGRAERQGAAGNVALMREATLEDDRPEACPTCQEACPTRVL